MNYKLTPQSIDDFILPEALTSKKLPDGGGLHLLITHSGKYWRYNYRHEGKFKTLALGVYPDVSLKKARNEHQAAKALLREGIDPCAVRRDEKQAQRKHQNLNQRINKNLKQGSVTVSQADYLFELERQGIGFYYSHTTEPYIEGFFMTAMDLIAFREDPVLFLATRHGVNRSVYLAWMNANHQVQCSAYTKAGKRCQHIVKHRVDAKTFEQMQDARCIQH